MKVRKFIGHLSLHGTVLFMFLAEYSTIWYSVKDTQTVGWSLELFRQFTWFKLFNFMALFLPLLLFISMRMIIPRLQRKAQFKKPRPLMLYDLVIALYFSYFVTIGYVAAEIFEWNRLMVDSLAMALARRSMFEDILAPNYYAAHLIFEISLFASLIPALLIAMLLYLYVRIKKCAHVIVRNILPFLKICAMLIFLFFLLSVERMGWSWDTVLLFYLMELKCIICYKTAQTIVNFYKRKPHLLLLLYNSKFGIYNHI